MAYCSSNETDHSSDDEIGNYQQSDFEISSTNQKNKKVDSTLEPVFLIKNSTADKITTILKRFSILLVHGEKFSTSVKEDLKKDAEELLHTLIELPIRSDEQDQSNQSSIEFPFKITMEQKNQLIDQLIKNKDFASFNVSNEMKKDLVSINCKLIIFLFHQSLKPVDGNEIYNFNVNQPVSLNDSSPDHQETNETQRDVNQIEYFNETKNTPPEHEDIWKAIGQKDLKAVDYFIRIKQIDPNLIGKHDNSTLLHCASSFGNLEIVKYLVSKGADINARAIYSGLPLNWACMNGKLEIVKYFISELKMDPNSKGNLNSTCLHLAVQSNNLELVKFLIENGAKKSLHQKNNSQETPLEYAEYCGSKKELIEYLGCQY